MPYIFTSFMVGILPGVPAFAQNSLPASGNVGVGTGTPMELFTVQSNTRAAGFRGTTNSPDAASLFYTTDDTGWRFTIGKRMLGNGTYVPQFTLMDNGNVGIGTTSPSNGLHVMEGATFNRSISIGTTDLQAPLTILGGSQKSGFMGSLASPNAGGLFYDTDNTGWRFTFGKRVTGSGAYVPQMILMDSGAVTIGTTTPAGMLHVAGDVVVDGNIGAKYQDVAEWVPTIARLTPGAVVIVDSGHTNRVQESDRAYDIRVVGVVSDRPGILLGEGGDDKVKVAHSGRVKVKVDATFGAIAAGDLLVSSSIPGYAMRSEPVKIGDANMHRPGTILGKALESLDSGQGEILVLLTLQ
jgi:hypothetical protein